MSIHYDEKGKFFTDVVPKVAIPAVIQTLTHRVHGEIHIRRDERIADALNKGGKDFLVVTDASVYNVRGTILYHTDFIALHRSHIVWIIPQDELRAEDNPSGEAT